MYTYEDETSLGEKVKYVKDNNYGGIIFWELAGDAPLKGSSLTDVIYKGFLEMGVYLQMINYLSHQKYL